jgi:hypothetical protein
MPTSMTGKRGTSDRFYRTRFTKKTYSQTVNIATGCLMVIFGLSGILNPSFIGMHLGTMHVLVLLVTGAFAIWSSTFGDDRRIFLTCAGLSIFYYLHAFAGLFLGSPGIPQIGYDRPDELLLRIAPGFLELATMDHIFHAVLATLFLSGAISWKQRHSAKMR